MHASTNQAANYLDQIETYVARMPSLSATATKVLQTCNDPQSSPNDLNRLIALDPVLAGQVLRLINSAYYSLSQPVSSLSRAIIMLGVNTVKNLVLSLAVLDQLRTRKPLRTLSGATFWSHSVAVGVTAKWFAEMKGVPLADQEEFFIGGLLHDLGKIALNHQFTAEYKRAEALAKRNCWPLVQAERAIFGIDHCVVGALIARKWRLSPALVDVLAHHHKAHESSTAGPSLVLLVARANFYASLLEGDYGEGALSADECLTDVMAHTGLDRSRLDEMRDTVLAEIDKAKIFLEISQKEAGHDR